MYPLPLKGEFGRADDLVLSLNPKTMMLNSGGVGGAASNGIVILVAGVCIAISFALAAHSFAYFDKGGYLWVVLINVVFLLVFGAAGAGSVGHLRKKPVCHPLLIDRGSGKLRQLQGQKLVEADWERLRPFIEPVKSVSTAGASTSCNLHLVQLSEDGKRAEKHMMVQSALGLYDCLSTYEFLARYIEGNWEGLPDIHLLPGERPRFWDAYRYGFFNPWIGVPRWEDRSPASRRWMWVLVPLWTLLFWPLVMLTIAGGRLGYVPKFDARHLTQTEYCPERDGVMPAALKRKMKPPRPLAQSERLLYWISMVGAAILWLGLALKMLMLVLD